MDQNFHLIEKYFQGKLDKDELQLFNQKLQQDPSFEQEFRDMKLIRDAVKETSRVRALDILQNAEANLTNQETTKINVSMKRLVSIAASLLIVATVSYFAFSGGTGALTGEEIVATYYKSYPNVVETIERGRTSSDVSTLRSRAYNAYDIKDYSTSADLFSNLLTSEKIAENFLYSGIANFETGNYKLAENHFNTVMNNFTELQEQAQWYLAMTLFKEKKEEEAITNIINLSLSKTSYKKDADRVLTSLNLTLDELNEDDGQIIIVSLLPPGSSDSPNGNEVFELRQYQAGEVLSLERDTSYPFWNDIPMENLKDGDLVDYILVNAKNSAFAVIIGKHN